MSSPPSNPTDPVALPVAYDPNGPTVVVVPTLNEAPNIRDLVCRVTAAAPDVHILVVDDDSTDGTAELAEQAFGGRTGHRVLRRTGAKGLGHAYAEAFALALAEGYENMIQMDADLSHDPAAIPSLREGLRHAHLVIGSRYCPGGGIRGWAPHRVWLSRFANLYARAITGMGVADITAGYRAWRAEALRRIGLDSIQSGGYSIQVETTVRAFCAGLRIQEVPIVFTDRRRGTSKMNHRVLLESVLMPWKLRAYIKRQQREERWRRSS